VAISLEKTILRRNVAAGLLKALEQYLRAKDGDVLIRSQGWLHAPILSERSAECLDQPRSESESSSRGKHNRSRVLAEGIDYQNPVNRLPILQVF
jgi:hypothetical protein